MTSEVQIQKTRSRVWISGSMHTLLGFEYSTQSDGKGKLDAWIYGSKLTLFGYENSTWGDGRAKLGFLIYLRGYVARKSQKTVNQELVHIYKIYILT